MADFTVPSVGLLAKAVQSAALAVSLTASPAPLPVPSYAPFALELAPAPRLTPAAAIAITRPPLAYPSFKAQRASGQAVDGFLAAAKEGPSPKTEAFLADLPAHFDGQSPERRAAVLETLDGLAHRAPQKPEYRRALQRLVLGDELRAVEPQLRRQPLYPGRRAQVLAETSYRDLKWYHRFIEEMSPPEGITYMDNGRIVLNVKPSWASLPSFVGHFRTLFTHEYTHRLQSEGEVSQALGAEIPAVSAEMLRAVEVYGLSGVQAGLSRLIHESLLGQFESGRQWTARLSAEPADESGFYWKGFLPGAAFELARRTGRWSDAWEFHRRVSAGVKPGQAARDILAAS